MSGISEDGPGLGRSPGPFGNDDLHAQRRPPVTGTVPKLTGTMSRQLVNGQSQPPQGYGLARGAGGVQGLDYVEEQPELVVVAFGPNETSTHTSMVTHIDRDRFRYQRPE